jgi:hypothetical protein
MVSDTPAVRIHNGRYTIESASGQHRTFEIRTQKPDAEFAPGKRILSILTGPENTVDYARFAFVDEMGIHVWASRAKQNDMYQVYAEQLWSLALDGAFSPFSEVGYRLLMEGRCVVCNRPLTTPESIRSGIGPICAEEKF